VAHFHFGTDLALVEASVFTTQISRKEEKKINLFGISVHTGKYSAYTKTGNNVFTLWCLFMLNLSKVPSKTKNNRGKGPLIAGFGINSLTANKQNREY
jgi:hypothetical protein